MTEDLIFYLLILALTYYWLIYLPTKKQLPTKTFSQAQTQTEPLTHHDNQDLENTLTELITQIKQLNQQIK